MRKQHTSKLREAIRTNIKHHIFQNLTNPARAYFFLRMAKWQMQASRTRKKWNNQGVWVPPFMAVSITSRCNLRCHGCYHHTKPQNFSNNMSTNQLKHLIAQAKEIGVSFILLLGGEPLARKDILAITQNFPEIIFPLLTNGIFLEERIIRILQKQQNVVPIISLEGPEQETDQRRGQGVFKHNMKVMKLLKKSNLLFGTNMTVTRQNFDRILNKQFIMELIAKGCKVIGFLEYLPLLEGTESLVITEEQRRKKRDAIISLRKNIQGVFFIDLPGDEDYLGGCLSSGRGFLHVSPEGHLEPCVFFPTSDSNIKDISLIEALQSPLLSMIREVGQQMGEAKRGCALWKHRELVKRPASAGICSSTFIEQPALRESH
ncbi:MAG: radical SAM/SPASM domain-containing protein [Candidatus Hodarchaeota archaeon]